MQKKNYLIFKVISMVAIITIQNKKLQKILVDVAKEFINATNKFGDFHNAHEGYAVLLEEVDELWDTIKLHQNYPHRLDLIKKETIQVSAMAIRILFDCCLF